MAALAIPFTAGQFHGVFRAYNIAVWPVQWVLVALGVAAVVLAMASRRGSGVAVSAILAALWAWTAVAYHLAFFSSISHAAYGFAALSAAGAVVFVREGVIRRSLTFKWTPGLKSAAGVALIVFALVVYPLWSSLAGHPYPETPTFGLSCPTTIFTIGLLCFAEAPTPRSPLIVPLLWCLVGSQAAFLFGVVPDTGLLAAAAVGIGLMLSAVRRRGNKPPANLGSGTILSRK